MMEQLVLPNTPEVPGWWTWLLPRYIGQPKHNARTGVVGKRHRPADQYRIAGPMNTGSIPVFIKKAWFLEICTPHGTCEIEVSEQCYDHTREDDMIPVEYRLSRHYIANKKISGKLLK